MTDKIKVPVPAGLICEVPVKKKYLTRDDKKKLKEREKKKKLAAIGKKSRRKGHSFERETAIMFRANGYLQASRQLEYQEGLGVDLKGTGIYDVQCKRSAKSVPVSAIKEVPIREGRVPLLVSKTDMEAIYVTMPIDHFFTLINRNQGEVLCGKQSP